MKDTTNTPEKTNWIIELTNLEDLTIAKAAFHATAQHFKQSIECLLLVNTPENLILLEYYQKRHLATIKILDKVNKQIADYHKGHAKKQP